MLSEEALQHNLESIKGQLRRFVDFDGDNPAQLVNNADWTMYVSVVEFLRDIGKNFRIGAGYNFTEFSDDLTDFDYDHEGWFLNMVGMY